MDGPASADLVKRAQAGAADALDLMYERCAARLLAFIRLRMGRELRARLESRDILQATLLKSLEHLPDFHGTHGGSLMAWLAKIAEHEIRDRVDYQKRDRRDLAREIRLETDPSIPAVARSALTQAIMTEEAERLEAALDELPPAYREIILLRKFQELSFADIGRRLGKSEDACRMLLARALTALTLALAESRR
jgi:RNA polymerase sigma-70 factor, ECF subfamily